MPINLNFGIETSSTKRERRKRDSQAIAAQAINLGLQPAEVNRIVENYVSTGELRFPTERIINEREEVGAKSVEFQPRPGGSGLTSVQFPTTVNTTGVEPIRFGQERKQQAPPTSMESLIVRQIDRGQMSLSEGRAILREIQQEGKQPGSINAIIAQRVQSGEISLPEGIQLLRQYSASGERSDSPSKIKAEGLRDFISGKPLNPQMQSLLASELRDPSFTDAAKIVFNDPTAFGKPAEENLNRINQIADILRGSRGAKQPPSATDMIAVRLSDGREVEVPRENFDALKNEDPGAVRLR